jgi:hypothetical protein
VSILTLGLGAAALLGAAAPASAAVTVAASAGNGTVGVAQTISATVASTSGATSGTVAFTANGQAIGSGQVGGSAGTKTQISWTPTSAASTVIEAKYTATNGDTASDSDTVTISRVGTAVSITAPSSATTSSKVAIVAVVRSSNGSYVPTGQVAFSLTNGTVIGTAGLDGSGRGSITYTVPSTAGTVTLLATRTQPDRSRRTPRSA